MKILILLLWGYINKFLAIMHSSNREAKALVYARVCSETTYVLKKANEMSCVFTKDY